MIDIENNNNNNTIKRLAIEIYKKYQIRKTENKEKQNIAEINMQINQNVLER